MPDELNYPRVTEVLNAFTSYDTVPHAILANAAARGTHVHSICAGIANGAWIPTESIEEEYIGYVRSFENWFDEYVAEVLLVESRYTDKAQGYTGQIDLLIRTKAGERCLVDLKTSAKPQKTYAVQMAAYCNLLDAHGIYVDRSMLVYLHKDGAAAKVVVAKDWDRELDVFRCALTCWSYFNGRKIKSIAEDTSNNGGSGLCTKGLSES